MGRCILFFLVLLFAAPSPALACSLCGSLGAKTSLVQEFENAHAVIYGHIANPRFEIGGTAGRGTTEFHFEKTLKDEPELARKSMILLSRYLPVLDAKDPPHYLMFFREPKKSGEPYYGRQLPSPAVLVFLLEYQRLRHDPAQALVLAANHFDDPDALIAEEAFMVFARSDDRSIGKLAKQLPPDKLRKLVRIPTLEPERVSMFAYLLGTCGNGGDAELLRSLLKSPNERNYKSFEGILAGYIALQPAEGWEYAMGTLKDSQTNLLIRYATLRAMRFFYNAKPEEFGGRVLEGMSLALAQPDVADVAVQELARWKRWEHTKAVLAAYDKASHQSPIVKNSILRYALVCPMPEAKAFVERVRQQDAELVRDFEEQLMLDAKK